MEFCRGCEVSCCSRYYIPLSIVDVFIISMHGWKDFYFIEQRDGECNGCFRVKGKYYTLKMKKRIQGGCVFLKEGGEYACGIHEYKPSVCAAYPFTREDGKIVMMENRECPKGRTPTEKDMMEAESALDDYEYEWGLHNRIVNKWNNSLLSKYGWPGLFVAYGLAQMLIWSAAAKLNKIERD